MATKSGMLRWLFKEGLSQGLQNAVQGAWLYAAPFVGAAMTFASSWLSPEVPWPYVITASGVMFAAIATGVLRVSEWRERNNAEGKVSLRAIAVPMALDGPPEDRKAKFVQIQPFFANSASFDMSYIVEDFRTSLADRYPPNKPVGMNKGVLPAGVMMPYYDNHIDLTGVEMKDTLVGTMEFRVRYGKPGRERYLLEKKTSLGLTRDEKTGFYNAVAQDVPA